MGACALGAVALCLFAVEEMDRSWLGGRVLVVVTTAMTAGFVWSSGYAYAVMPRDWRVPYWLVTGLVAVVLGRHLVF